MTGIRLRYITFTGPNVLPAELEFDDGLNIIYGASNTGKSFTSNAILFMLGVAKELPDTEEIAAYDAAWLGLTLPDERDVTLYRATKGGNFSLYEGLVSNASAQGGIVLRQKHDSRRTDSVSQMLLEEMGFAGKQIVRDGNGTKDILSIYLLSPYALVSEEDIIAERSPVFVSGVPAERTFEKNLFKLLITGKDDSARVTIPKLTDRKVAKAAKVELVDEMIAHLDLELGENPQDEKQTEQQLESLDKSADELVSRLEDAQKNLDTLVIERRRYVDNRRELQNRSRELDLTLERFAKLQAVYSSDLERLQSIEEGGFVLLAMAGLDCPICGAPSAAQKHNHASEEIAMAHKAAAAESSKIEREQLELAQTVISLEAESSGISHTIADLDNDIRILDATIQVARPSEATLRQSYEIYSAERLKLNKLLELYQRRVKLIKRRAEIAAEPTKREEKAPPAGPDPTTIFEFGETVKGVLTAWRFPDADKVQFDGDAYDITVAGKRRTFNGKGVRAILHAAFNVAVIVYCIKKMLPYPGFLVLDTPLLTYREPMSSRHGDLSADEEALKSTSLAEHFYKHLASLANQVQFIIIENSDPPDPIRDLARIETFTRVEGNGRYGLLAKKI